MTTAVVANSALAEPAANPQAAPVVAVDRAGPNPVVQPFETQNPAAVRVLMVHVLGKPRGWGHPSAHPVSLLASRRETVSGGLRTTGHAAVNLAATAMSVVIGQSGGETVSGLRRQATQW